MRAVRRFEAGLEPCRSGARGAAGGCLLAVLAGSCSSTPPPQPLEPAATLEQFSARRLEVPGLPPAAGGWDLAQWLAAALQLNPQLAAERAEVVAVAAGERTAAERPNPNMQLFGEYLRSAAESGAWLYGLSLDFLLRPHGERARARARAALATALAESDLSESLWQVRARLRQALLDAVAAQDESALLATLVGARQGLIDSDRARLREGDIARSQTLADELELAHAQQRAQQGQARAADARARLAAAVGVPVAALEAVPVRWSDWAAIDGLEVAAAEHWRNAALVGRPQIVHALREYDLAEVGLQSEAAKRWPHLEITPAYAWGGGGVRAESLNDVARESALAVSFELPLFNQHRGPIGEAVARRHAAGEQLQAVQAQIFAEIDRAELAWPTARAAWLQARDLAALATRQQQAESRALALGASERPSALAAQIVAIEAQLALLEAAYAAEQAYGALEDAYRRPLPAGDWPPAAAAPHS